MQKPSVFVGSSSKAIAFARAARDLLDNDAEITVWDEGPFKPGPTLIQNLLTHLKRFDFAILLLTPDDPIGGGDSQSFGPRDNVIFELGLFMGHLGPQRTFMVVQDGADVRIPSDLAGVTTEKFQWPRSDENHRSALGKACNSIRAVIKEHGMSEHRTVRKVDQIATRQDVVESQVRVVQVLIKGLVTKFEHEKLRALAAGGSFRVWFHNDMMTELYRLDKIGYLRPKNQLEDIRRQQDGRAREFDLKEYVEITDEGREYLKVRDELSPPADRASSG